MHEAHHKAFSVAKISQLDLLNDIQNSLIKAQKEGKSFSSWKKDIKPTLQAKGWLGEVNAINPKTGEIKTINVNNSRLKRIYETNMRSANAIGRAKAQYALQGEIYLQYSALMDGLTRPSHAKLNSIILHRDDPFWKINYPPNGWNCRCVCYALTKRDLEKKGLKVSKTPPNIAEKDFAYDTRGLKNHLDSNAIFKNKKELYKDNTDFSNALSALESQHLQSSKNLSAIKELLKSKDSSAKIAIAKLPKELAELLKTKANTIYLSNYTLKTHLEKHPEVTLMDYSLLPFLLDNANIISVKHSKENHIVVFTKFGKYYRAAIKTTQDKEECFLLSLVKGSEEITK